VNNFYFRLTDTDQGIELPIQMDWDFLGKQDAIVEYESTVLDEIVGTAVDFEVSRFSHNEYSSIDPRTAVIHEFNFYSSGITTVSATTPANVNLWENSYLAEGFNSSEIYYFSNSFTNSFFKLDFYDSNDVKSQTNYFTIIIPTQQGLTQTASTSSYLSNVNIKRPYFILDYVGDKEGFFIYWLTDTNFLDISTFYMSAKFFDAKIGVFVKMMTKPQAVLPNKFIFDGSKLFFHKVELNYTTKTYEIYDGDSPNTRIGTIVNPIKWYEYINPPQ
jgi:hypothetical protein